MRRGVWRAALVALAALVAPAALSVSGCQKRKPVAAKVAPVTSGSAGAPAPPDEDDPSAPRVAEIDLREGAPEIRPPELFRQDKGSFFELIEAADDLRGRRDRHAGVMVRLGTSRLGWSRAAELGRALKAVREAGKPVFCHAHELGNSSYFLAATACDRIFVSPAGGVETVGLAAELVHAKELLAKVGAEADILQVGKYKGTGEMLTRDSASEEHRASLQGALGGIRARFLEVVASRNHPEALAVAEGGPYSPAEAVAAGLIDEVGYEGDALLALRRRASAGGSDVLFGDKAVAGRGKRGGAIEILRGLSGAKRGGSSSGAPVAVLRASGSIVMERTGNGLLRGSSGIVAKTMLKQLKDLTDDDDTKAVVLRIDSPGGSALASDLLWNALMQLRARKPLVVSVGDMAASGGYYMACAGSKILADEASIVGSIGVVGGKVALGGALKKIGVNVEIVPADPASDGARASYESMLTRWDDATRARVLSTMTSVYDLFLDRVAKGRGVPVDKVKGFAEGRIFAGRQALELGMIDRTGGLEDAIALARSEAGLSADAGVRVVGAKGGLLDALGLGDGDGEADGDASARGLEAAAGASLPWREEWGPFVGSLTPLLDNERALVAVPFALLVR